MTSSNVLMRMSAGLVLASALVLMPSCALLSIIEPDDDYDVEVSSQDFESVANTAFQELMGRIDFNTYVDPAIALVVETRIQGLERKGINEVALADYVEAKLVGPSGKFQNKSRFGLSELSEAGIRSAKELTAPGAAARLDAMFEKHGRAHDFHFLLVASLTSDCPEDLANANETQEIACTFYFVPIDTTLSNVPSGHAKAQINVKDNRKWKALINTLSKNGSH